VYLINQSNILCSITTSLNMHYSIDRPYSIRTNPGKYPHYSSRLVFISESENCYLKRGLDCNRDTSQDYSLLHKAYGHGGKVLRWSPKFVKAESTGNTVVSNCTLTKTMKKNTDFLLQIFSHENINLSNLQKIISYWSNLEKKSVSFSWFLSVYVLWNWQITTPSL